MVTQQLQKLAETAPCGLCQCGQPAHWLVLGSAHGPEVAACDVAIVLMSDMNDDNERFFRPALDEIAGRS